MEIRESDYEQAIELIRKVLDIVVELIQRLAKIVHDFFKKEYRKRLPRPPKKILPSKEAPVFEIRARARSRC